MRLRTILPQLFYWPMVVALALSVGLLLLPPHGSLAKSDRAAFAVCHRLPEHSFFVAGRQLPLCARDSGTYLGATAVIIVLLVRGRGRASRFPRRGIMAILGLFVLAWAVDGVNSFAELFTGTPLLYPPHNELRLISGALQGLAIAAFGLPAFNLAVWAPARENDAVRVIDRPADLGWLLVGAALVVAAVAAGFSALLYPLTVASGLAIVFLLSAVNAVLATLLLRREARAGSWRDAAPAMVMGLVLALAEIVIIGWARAWLEIRFGLPI